MTKNLGLITIRAGNRLASGRPDGARIRSALRMRNLVGEAMPRDSSRVLYVCVNTFSRHIAMVFLDLAQPQGYEQLAAGLDAELASDLWRHLFWEVSCSGLVSVLDVFRTRHAGGEVLKPAVQTK